MIYVQRVNSGTTTVRQIKTHGLRSMPRSSHLPFHCKKVKCQEGRGCVRNGVYMRVRAPVFNRTSVLAREAKCRIAPPTLCVQR